MGLLSLSEGFLTQTTSEYNPVQSITRIVIGIVLNVTQIRKSKSQIIEPNANNLIAIANIAVLIMSLSFRVDFFKTFMTKLP